jgi:hypothetical protein
MRFAHSSVVKHMSMELYVFHRGELAVDPPRLKGALEALEVEATVLHDFESANGFWPIDMAGVRTGVEIYLGGDVREISEGSPVLEAALNGHDKLITFVWCKWGDGGTALVLAAALAKVGDVIIYEPSDGVVLSPEHSAREGREFLERAKEEGEFSQGD